MCACISLSLPPRTTSPTLHLWGRFWYSWECLIKVRVMQAGRSLQRSAVDSSFCVPFTCVYKYLLREEKKSWIIISSFATPNSRWMAACSADRTRLLQLIKVWKRRNGIKAILYPWEKKTNQQWNSLNPMFSANSML